MATEIVSSCGRILTVYMEAGRLCECGCGDPAPIATKTGDGWRKGQQKRFVQGHHNRLRSRPAAERFWEKVQRGSPDECWPWLASCLPGGYGQFAPERTAHRFAWVLTHGPIADGLFVCHHCDNRKCCNPAHLFLGTPAENTADMKRKGRAAGPAPGEGHHSSRLTEADVREIRQRVSGGETQRSVADSFGLSVAHCHRIVHRQRWKHI